MATRKKPRYLKKPRRLSGTIQIMSGKNSSAFNETSESSTNDNDTAVVTMSSSTAPTNETEVSSKGSRREKHVTNNAPPLTKISSPPEKGTRAVESSVSQGRDHSTLHVSCTVASPDSDNLQNRHHRSRGSLVCVECGMRFSSIKKLQNHIQSKTIWTNRSLLGCRVSVMWAHNQWYEGTVTEYDAVHGHHCVVYDDGEQKRYHMSNKTFYVVNHHNDDESSSDDDDDDDDIPRSKIHKQTKRSDPDCDFESKFYEESLSKEYLLAQSVVHACFGNSTQQVGYRTDGHLCVTEQDRIVAHDTGSSLLYGEVLPRVSFHSSLSF